MVTGLEVSRLKPLVRYVTRPKKNLNMEYEPIYIMNRDNYYIILELSINPPETDPNKIETAIKAKQADWSRLRNHPTKGRKAQQYLGWLSDMKQVMLNDATVRQKEAQEAQKIASEKFKKLDNYIAILAAKGYVLEDEVTKLVKDFTILAEAEIRGRIKVKIRKEEKPASTTKKVQPLEKTTAKKMTEALQLVGKSSLYEFLGLSPTSSLKTLMSRAKDQDVEIRKIAQKDAVITASGELIGFCLMVFKDQDTRDRYDVTLAQAGLEELDKKLRLAGTGGSISTPTYEQLLKEAITAGLAKEEAKEYIINFCKQNKWFLEVPTKSVVEDLPQCGVCNVLNAREARHCEKCGYPLQVECPSCKQRHPSTAKVCNHCGFNIGDMRNGLDCLRRAKLALAENNLAVAESLLQQADVFYPNHADIKPLLATVQTKKQEIQQVVQTLQDAVNQRNFYQARQIISKLKQLDAKHPELSLASRIEQRITAAEKWLQQAKTVTKEDARIEAYTQALTEAKDCQAAIEEMTKLPPESAYQLKAMPVYQGISLSWSASPSKGNILYRVIRKEDSKPLNSSDGIVLGETSQLSLEDTKTIAGQEYCYAVYAVRGEALSLQAALAGPVMRLAEVEALKLIPGDKCINLHWKIPDKAQGVEVWRKPNTLPTKSGDGQRITGVRRDGVMDTGLSNGVSYGYLVLTIFQNRQGDTLVSKGATHVVMPVEPPQPITDLVINKQGDILHLSWTSPKRGSVQLFYSEITPSFSDGENLATAELSQLGQPLPIQRAGSTQWKINFQGRVFITPVTVVGDVAVVGTGKVATSISEVSQLRHQLDQDKLYLEWSWPPGASQILVTWRKDQYPDSPEDGYAVRKIVTPPEYERRKAFILKLEKTDYYFKLFVVAGETGKEIYSAGESYCLSHREPQEIFYEVRLRKSIFGKLQAVELWLKTPGDDLYLPEMVLVKKVGNLPSRRNDGTVVIDLKNTLVCRQGTVIEIPETEWQPAGYGRLFFTDDTNYTRYRLLTPARERLKLG